MTWRMTLDALAGALFRVTVGIAIAFLLIPLVVAVFLSFDDREYLGAFPPKNYSLRWYWSFIDNPSYLDGLYNSLQVSLISTAIAVVAGAGAALFLARFRFKGREALETLFLSPKFVPTVVVGFSLLGFAAAIGIYDPFTRLIMGHVIVTIPFTVRATLASLIGIRASLIEAALSLGARPWRAYLDIILPLARTGIVAGALMAFVLSFDEVAVSLFLSDAFTQTLPIVLVAEMRANLNLTVAAVSTVFLALTLIVLIGLDRTLGLDRLVGEGIYRG
jgi:putative spermidine/putrescine transport system permease protein